MSLISLEDDNISQGLISKLEPCTFTDSDIENLKISGSFPPNTIFKPFNPSCPPDLLSDKWVCFPEYPFTIGLKFPFPPLITEFFATTKLCFIQAMPMVWRTLSVIQSVIDSQAPDLWLPELAQNYYLRTHGSYYFLFKVRPDHSYLVLQTKQNDPNWKSRFFFVDRSSLSDCSKIPSSWSLKVDFEALAPPDADTEKRLEAFLEIPEEDRTFKCPSSSGGTGSQESQNSMSAPLISLIEIDNDTSEEKSTPAVTKSKMPNLRSRSSKKRKTESNSEPVNSDPELLKILEQFSKWHEEKVLAQNDLCKSLSAKEVALNKEVAELKKKINNLEAYILKITSGYDADLEKAKEELLSKMKRDATITVLEARVRMATEVSAKGFDTSMWPINAWEAKLARIKSNDPELSEASAAKAPKVMKNPPADPQGTSKMDQLASTAEVLEGFSTENKTMGEEGI